VGSADKEETMRTMFLVAFTAAACTCWGCAGGSQTASGTAAQSDLSQGAPAAVVGMTSTFNYKPEKVTVKVGDTIEWKNTSLITHTVTADPAFARDRSHVLLPAGVAPFNSGEMPRHATFRYTFTVPGLYRYFCIPHEKMGMVGEVVVTP
jgi:plastocyanin